MKADRPRGVAIVVVSCEQPLTANILETRDLRAVNRKRRSKADAIVAITTYSSRKCPSACLSVCLSVCFSACLSASMSCYRSTANEGTFMLPILTLHVSLLFHALHQRNKLVH